MARLAVRAEELGKLYRIGQIHPTLRDSVQRFVRSPRRTLRALAGRHDESELLWALRHVSFELEPGAVLGIVGRNGAGKSTLLKILTRITVPTEGHADVWGRVASLLEVGTGFHPELTGRDNVYLNGAILGMSRAEVRRKFDAIVGFAGVERFVDTPVKRYSSGMYMRLAFSVAAHLEPDVLLVDEVLAVGDADFQKRSVDKMREVTSEGRTVLFVSHNLASVKALCSRALLLRDGRIVADGPVDDVVATYLQLADKALPSGEIPSSIERTGSGEARFDSARLTSADGAPLAEVFLGQPFAVELGLDVERPVHDAMFELGISAADGTRVATAYSTDRGGALSSLERGSYRVRAAFDVTLLPGVYSVDVALHHGSLLGYTIDAVDRVVDFDALGVSEDGEERHRLGTVRGFVRVDSEWHDPVRVDDDAAPEETLTRSLRPRS
jgi:lipopolysaccharide transport system ATP-binding protein